jgi:hypothetical protein
MTEAKAIEAFDNIKRDAMIEMLEAFDQALGMRAQKWMDEHNGVPRIVFGTRKDKKNAGRKIECKIRFNEIQEIRKLVTATIKTCKEQNAGPLSELHELEGKPEDDGPQGGGSIRA